MGGYIPNYLKAIVIVHGKSEKQICDFIKSKLRLKLHVESDKNGEKSIQITSVMNTLKNTNYKNETVFLKCFDDIELVSKGKKDVISDKFKIFIIMDTDDCKQCDIDNFKNKNMFRNHWACKYITPIYNITNLEDALLDCGVKFEKKGNDRKKEYIKIFPTDKKYLQKEIVQLEDFYEKLSKTNKSNMDVFVKFCIECSKENSFL